MDNRSAAGRLASSSGRPSAADQASRTNVQKAGLVETAIVRTVEYRVLAFVGYGANPFETASADSSAKQFEGARFSDRALISSAWAAFSNARLSGKSLAGK